MLTRYLGNLSQLFSTMEVSDRAGTRLSLDDGAAAGIELIRSMKNCGGKAIVVGNGGSAAIASHTQNDLCKAVGVRAVVFTEPPLLTALSNDESYESAYESLVKLWAAKGDLPHCDQQFRPVAKHPALGECGAQSRLHGHHALRIRAG